MNIEDYLWVEKYRPKHLKDLQLPDVYMKKFSDYIRSGEIPHLLLFGPPGGGKSTLALIICSENGILQNKQDNLIEINGSAKSERGISITDEVIEPFLRYPPGRPDQLKIVFIDEADNMTEQAFRSLRGIIEKYQRSYGRFIFTCNYISKIPVEIRSRFEEYEFSQLPIEYIKRYLNNILTNEKIEFSEKELEYIINDLYPDIRRMIFVLHKSCIDGKLVLDHDILNSNEKKVISNIIELISGIKKNISINDNIENIIEILNGHEINYSDVYRTLFFTKGVPAMLKIIVNDYSVSHSSCLVPSMHFMAMVYKIIKALREYTKLKSSIT